MLILLMCMTLAVATGVNLGHLGKTIPLHIPTQTVTVNETFDVPPWLGAYYATVDVASAWTLPLTIGNGGQAYPGEFLIIRNYGPASITLYPQTPETLDGASSYLIPSGTVAEILSGYPNWVVTNLPNFNNQNVTAENLEVECWASIGTPDTPFQNCGDLTVTRIWSPNAITADPARAIHYSTPPTDSINSGTPIGIWFNSVLNSTGVSSSSFTGFQRRVQLMGTDSVRSGTVTGNNDQIYFTSPFRQSGTIRAQRILNAFGPQVFPGNYTFSGGLTGSSVSAFVAAGTPGSFYVFSTFIRGHAIETPVPSTINVVLSQGGGGYDVEPQTYTSSPVNWAYRYVEQTGATKNTGIWANTNAANSGAGWCTGTAIDTCQYRGRAGAWTGDAGVDWYSESGHFCAGTGCTAMSASNVGIYDSATRVVRSCTSGAGITCSVTDGVLTVSANQNLDALQSLQSENESLKQRMEQLEAQVRTLLAVLAV